MAELLLFAPRNDPMHAQGDIISCAPDGYAWGGLEYLRFDADGSPHGFAVVRVTDASLRALAASWPQLLDGVDTGPLSDHETAMAVAVALCTPWQEMGVNALMEQDWITRAARRYHMPFSEAEDRPLIDGMLASQWYVPTVPASRIVDKAAA